MKFAVDDPMDFLQTHVVYALSLDGQTYRYVGKTAQTAVVRLKGHLTAASGGQESPLYDWIREVGSENVTISVLEVLPSKQGLGKAEVTWIRRLISEGHPLLNKWGTKAPTKPKRKYRKYDYSTNKPKDSTMPLKDWIASQPIDATHPHPRCKTCALPRELLEQIHEARSLDNPISFPLIAEWLEHDEQTYLHPATIRNHFIAGHHRESQ